MKKNTGKRILSMLLCVLMVISLLPVSALAEENATTVDEVTEIFEEVEDEITVEEIVNEETIEVEGNNSYMLTSDSTNEEIEDGPTYSLNDSGNAVITGYRGEVPSVLFIPADIDGYTVTAIKSGAFNDELDLVSVDIPETVTSLPRSAFSGCENLTDIYVDEDNAVYTSIDGVVFTKDAITLKIYPYGKNGAYSVPDGTVTIAEGAFSNCADLTSVLFADSVTVIENSAFSGCSSLASITLPKHIESIDYNAFKKCVSLTKITIPKSLTTCGYFTGGSTYGVFNGCSELKTIYFEEGIETIPANIFRDCTGLESIVIPDTVTTIGARAFADCVNLTSVTIPNSVTTTGSYVFGGCTALDSVGIPDSITTISTGLFSGCTGLTSIDIPDSVTVIENSAFSGCSNLASVTLPKYLKSIDYNAFKKCVSLTEITIPKSLATCGYYTGGSTYGVFNGCSELKTIYFEEGVETIPSNFLRDCPGIESIVIPNSVTTLGNHVFRDCVNLKSVSIPDSVTSVGTYAFSGCVALESVSLSNSMTTISSRTFSGCTELASIILPDGITTIDTNAFTNCSGLSDLELPDSLTTINDYAFNGCTGLISVVIPEGVTTIGEGSFKNCSGMYGVYFKGDAPGVYEAAADVPSFPTAITLYYFVDRSGWTTPSWEGYATCACVLGSNEEFIQSGLSLLSSTPANGECYEDDGYFGSMMFYFTKNINPELDWSTGGCIQVCDYATDEVLLTIDEENFEDYDGNVYGEIANDLTLRTSLQEFGPGQYYITISPDLVVAAEANEDGTYDTFAGLEKGDLVYTVKLPVTALTQNGTFRYTSTVTSETATYNYEYDDNWFFESSYRYNHNLATMSMCAALAGAQLTPENILDLYQTLGFENRDAQYVTPGADTIGYVIGSKTVRNETGEEFSLIAVTVRGGGYDTEWASNFTVGNNSNHQGFDKAATEVYNAVLDYIYENELDNGNLKIWITGYSRAAATTNIAAYWLDLAANENSIKGLEPQDIFAYCFECPRTTTDYNQGGELATNIFSIVNHIDLVPKVAMRSWGFYRYGITYCLPSSELTYSAYSDYYDRMNARYSIIIADTSTEKTVEELTATIPGQGEILNSLADGIALLERDTYVDSIQSIIRGCIIDGMNLPLASGLITLIGVAFAVAPKETTSTISAAILIYTSLKDEIETIKFGHYPELCLAWIEAIEAESDYVNPITRLLRINCPVDIEVYDSNDVLVAKIVDGVAQDVDGSFIGAYIDENDQKIVVLPQDEVFTVKVTATNSGTMSYQIEEKNVETGSIDHLVNYFDIPIERDDMLTGIVENLNTGDAEYPLFSEDGYQLIPNTNVAGDVNSYSLTVTAEEGGTVCGGGHFVIGEYAKVSAEPASGYAFVGWYSGNELISEDAEYRLRIEQDMELVARFKYMYLFGDINADDKVNALDLVSLMKYTLGMETDVREEAIDLNGDDTTDILDVICLLKYLAGEDVELN